MRTTIEIIPIIVFVVLAILTFAVALIMNIMSRRSVLKQEQEIDFIQLAIDKKKNKIESGMSGMSFKLYVFLIIAVPLVTFFVFWLGFKDLYAGIVLGFLGVFLPSLIIKFLENRQQRAFEERYEKALKSMSSAMQSGMTIQQAVEDVTTNPFIHDSIKKGFRQIDADIKIGLSIPEAFLRYAQESKSIDAYDMAAAISMQTEVGGSEASVVENIANNIRERIMLRKEMKTFFSDTTMMVNIMGLLPFLIVALLYFGAKQLIEPFFASTGMLSLLGGILAFSLVGTIYLRHKLRQARGGNV